MDPITIDPPAMESQSSQPDAPKKRKYTKKKQEAKISKPTEEATPIKSAEPKEDVQMELVHYAHKLEFELISAKKKLNRQCKQFKNMISSLTIYLNDKGISPEMISECIKLPYLNNSIDVQAIGLHLNDSDTESNFERLYTTHKYRLVEENKDDLLKGPLKTGKKISENKQHPQGIENDDVIMVHASGEKPKKKKEKTEKAEKAEKNTEENGGETKPKKKREKKKGTSDEHNANSNSTAATTHDEHHQQHHETKEAPNKADDKKSNTKEFIRIDDDNTPQPQAANFPENNLNQMNSNVPFNMNNPLGAFQQALGKEALAYNKIFQDLLKMSNTSLPPNLLNYYQSGFK